MLEIGPYERPHHVSPVVPVPPSLSVSEALPPSFPLYSALCVLIRVFALRFLVNFAYPVKRFAPHVVGSGVPDIKTILSGGVIRGYLNG